MSDKSLFDRHWRLINQDESQWSEEDKQEFARLQDLQLPPLELKPSLWNKFRLQIQIGLSAVVTASLALFYFLPQTDRLSAKGGLQVSVFWERAGKVSPLTSETILSDGDKIGAKVNSSEESYAYWAITDNNLKVISGVDDIESSRVYLEPGVSKSFESSFVLTAPNQGEHLVVVVCPKKEISAQTKLNAKTPPIDSLFNHEFVTQLFSESRLTSSNCIFAGYRLRRMP